MFDIDPKNKKIIVEITEASRKKKKPEDEEEDALGMLPTGLLRKPVIRRKRTNQIYINLYDLGQFASGEDIPFVYNVPSVLSVDPVSNFFSRENDYRYQDAFNAYILGFAPGSLKETFKRIENPLQYAANVNNASGDREPKGFPVAKSSSVSSIGGRAIQYFNTGLTEKYKITKEPSFNAAESGFTLNKDADIYLIPLVVRWTGAADVWTPVEGEDDDRQNYLANYFYKPIPRSFGLNNALWEAQFNNPFYASVVMPQAYSLPVYPLALREAWKTLHTTNPDSNLIKTKYFVAFFYRNYISHQSVAPAEFPTSETPNIYYETFNTTFIQAERPYFWLYHNITLEGMLCAIIKKQDTFYYVWNKADSVLDAAQGYLIAT